MFDLPFHALLLALGGPGPAQSAVELVEERSEHYRLLCAGTDEQRRELGLVLERAFGEFADFLGNQPKKRALPLEVVVFASDEGWKQGLASRAAVPPPGVERCWFRTEDRVAYTHWQWMPSVTRTFLLNVAWQQFHFAAEPKNRDLAYCWYVTGLAEFVSLHRWDGERLEIGVRPLISWHDMPDLAQREFDATAVGMAQFTNERLRSPPSNWAYVSFLLTGPNPEYESRFRKLALGSRGSKLTGEDFARSIGDPEIVARELDEWLLGAQLPFQPICGDWFDLDGSSLRASAARGVGLAILKSKTHLFEVEIEVHAMASGCAGVIVDWKDIDEYVCAQVRGSRASIHQVKDGCKLLVEEHPCKVEASTRFTIQRGSGSTALLVDGRSIYTLDGEEPTVGLFVQDGVATFRGLSWR